LHDPATYKDPMTFNPDRLIAKPGKPAETDPFEVAFGYGRRWVASLCDIRSRATRMLTLFSPFPLSPPSYSACPGAQLAQSILFIFAATVLSVFNIEKVVINGVVQEPKNAFSSGVLVYVPLPFFSLSPIPHHTFLC
jgi:cytochrome P450